MTGDITYELLINYYAETVSQPDRGSWNEGVDDCDYVESDYEPAWEEGPVGNELD